VFGTKLQLHIVDGDRFIADPLSEVRRVERFLSLDALVQPAQLQFNDTKGFYCFKRTANSTLKCLGDSKGRPHVYVADATRSRLRELYKEHNERFFDMIGRRFDW
jgi:hypothetical protein